MARGSLKLAYIESNSRRKACYKKRKKGLFQKVEELSTLCGVDACAVMYSPFDEGPQIWPPSHSAVEDIIKKFKRLSVVEQNRKTLNQESFARQMLSKFQERSKNLTRENRQKQLKLLLSGRMVGEAQDFTMADLNQMRCSIYSFMQRIIQKIEAVKGQSVVLAQAAAAQMMPSIGTSGATMAIQTAGGGNCYLPEVGAEMPQYVEIAGLDNGYNPVVYPEIPMDYSQNPIWATSVMVQNEQSANFVNGYEPAVPPEMPMNYFQNPTWRNEQSAGFCNGYDPIVAPGMPVNYSQNHTQGISTLVQNNQSAGFDNGNHPVFAPEIPIDYSQNPTWGLNTMVEQSAGLGNGYDVAFAPEMSMNDPPNPTAGMNTTVPHEQSAVLGDDFDVAVAPAMPMNDPQIPTSGMNTVVPHEQPAGSDDFDWIDYLFGDDYGAAPSFASP